MAFKTKSGIIAVAQTKALFKYVFQNNVRPCRPHFFPISSLLVMLLILEEIALNLNLKKQEQERTTLVTDFSGVKCLTKLYFGYRGLSLKDFKFNLKNFNHFYLLKYT